MISLSICEQTITLGFMLMKFVLSYKAWNVVKPGAWLARPSPGAQ